MVGLSLCIFFTVLIFLIFKSYSRYKVNTFQAVVVNYITCSLMGILFNDYEEYRPLISLDNDWFLWVVLLGVSFVFTFYLMAITTQRLSVAVATIANKMSLAITVVINLFLFHTSTFTGWNYVGVALALVSIILVAKKKNQVLSVRNEGAISFILPLIIFIMGGLIDSLIGFINLRFEEYKAFVPLFCFSSAAITGSLFLIIRLIVLKNTLSARSVVGGIILGSVNYFSIYFLLIGLSAFNNEGAVVFPIINIAMILLSSLGAYALFQEKLSLVNKIGIVIAIIAMVLVSYQKSFDALFHAGESTLYHINFTPLLHVC